MPARCFAAPFWRFQRARSMPPAPSPSPLLVFFRIRLPLAFRLAMPGLTNLVMTTLKSTLVSAIGLQDLIRVAGDAAVNTKEFFQFYMATLVIYLGIAAVVLLLQTARARLFRHLRVGR